MKATIIMLCLIGAAFANPIFYIAPLDSNSGESNSSMSLSDSHSSENDTSSVEQSFEENLSSQSSESSESLESNSEDKTSEESESNSLEDPNALIDETRDNNSEEERNVRKSWLSVFASVVHSMTAEGSSTEVTGQLVTPPSQNSSAPIIPLNLPGSSIAQVNKNLLVPMVSPTAAGGSNEPSEGPDNTNRLVGVTEAHKSIESSSSSSSSSESSQSKSSESKESSQSSSSQSKSSQSSSSQSESSESNESSESKESSQSKVSSESSESNGTSSAASDSSEDSKSSDSTDKKQIKSKDCSQGANRAECESEEEYIFQDIGDDAQYSLENLMAPKDNHLLELSWRR